MREITNEQKQVMLSGILGDGCLQKNGAMSFSCIHKGYLEYKKKLLGEMLPKQVSERINSGYKIAPIFHFEINTSKLGKKLAKYTYQDIVNEMDELGIALWLYDDGSRHKEQNFYNICTHALDRSIEEKVIIPFLNKHNIFPKILTEVKKDGREFTYLFVSKWRGAMELSRMMRNLPIPDYSYKLVPIEIENAYFAVKDEDDFKGLSVRGKTNYIKKYLGLTNKQFMHKEIISDVMQK